MPEQVTLHHIKRAERVRSLVPLTAVTSQLRPANETEFEKIYGKQFFPFKKPAEWQNGNGKERAQCTV